MIEKYPSQETLDSLTPQQLLASAKRELGMRRDVYQRRVEGGGMNPRTANHEIACMAAIVDLLDRHTQGRLF